MSTTDFQQAVKYVNNGPPLQNVTNDVKLQFYALYKQATDGPCKETAPSRLQVVKRMKWDAHNKLGQMSKEDAKKQYVSTLLKIAPKWKDWKPADKAKL